MSVEPLSFGAHPVQVSHRVLVSMLSVYDESAVGLAEHAVILRHPAGFLEALLEEAVPTVACKEQCGCGRSDAGGHVL
ncbi:hypothetical protein [Streptomyces leeuwenhoekii]|uniref:hypothetical protein n=1 Tax=Streptomyces leeuwenhoekii TaxID=1437453 RepID=UPI001411FB54|nr:hypothetical protein [Streptomyces leeuwenhoekii]